MKNGTVTAYGRVTGKIQYQYGPKTFDADWNSVFKAIEIIGLLHKIPTSLPIASGLAKKLIPKSQRPGMTKMAMITQDLKLKMLSEELKPLMIGIEHMLISKETVHYLRPNDFSSKFVSFSESSVDPAVMLANCLEQIGLNSWGILSQICLALADFTAEAPSDGGHLCVTMHFTM